MTTFIRNLSANGEFCLIMLLCFMWSIGAEAWMAFRSEHLQFNDAMLVRWTIIQVLLLSVVLWIGRIRGWSFSTFGARISWKGTGGGILLFVATYVALMFIFVIAYNVHPERMGYTSLPLAMPVILLVSVINPVFEEVLEVGYFIHSLRRFGVWRVVLASALFRATLHIYQGIDGALSIFVMGIIFGFTYWRWRQLWPLIVAHSLADFLGFLNVNHHAI